MMEKWKNGKIRRWKNGRLEECEDGRIYHGDTENTEMEGNADWRLLLRFALCARLSATQTSKLIYHENI